MSKNGQGKKLQRSRWTRLGWLVAAPLGVALAWSAITRAEVALPKTWEPNQTLTAKDLNDNFGALRDAMVDVSSDQVIRGSKTFESSFFQVKAGQVQQFITSFHPEPAYQSYLFIERGRGTPGEPGSVAAGDDIGRIYGRAYLGGEMRSTTMIKFFVDGAPGEASVPGAISFLTSNASSAEHERMRITSSGRVGIGTDAPRGSLDVAGYGGWSTFNYGTQLIISTAGSSNPTIGILDSGNENPWAITNGGGDLVFSRMPPLGTNAENPGLRVAFRDDGTTYNTTGEWTTQSDRRLKRDIRPITGALDTVCKLDGVSFRWKDAQKDRERGRVQGFIAQDVERVKPEWVRVGPDGYRELQTIGMDAILVEAIKEQQGEIQALQRANRELQERLDRVEAALGVRKERS